MAEVQTWRAASRCAGRPEAMEIMFDRYQQTAARSICATCPVAEVCLWTAMEAEADATYRYGVFGGTTPAARRRLAEVLSQTEIRARLEQAVASWPVASRTEVPWTPPTAPGGYRRRKCRGCKAPIVQPRAGRPKQWCTKACYQRSTRDAAADAAKKRQEWRALSEKGKEQRREAMRQRWANLSAEQRAELAARRRQRRKVA